MEIVLAHPEEHLHHLTHQQVAIALVVLNAIPHHRPGV
jgi:hypothetical protein